MSSTIASRGDDSRSLSSQSHSTQTLSSQTNRVRKHAKVEADRSGRLPSRQPVACSRTSDPAMLAWSRLIETAQPGDHHAIFRFLNGIQHSPSETEFQAQLEAADYQANNRLIIRLQHDVVAHVRLLSRAMRVGTKFVSTVTLADLAALPELQGRGCITAMLSAAEERLDSRGALLAIIRTDMPQWFAGRGWFVGPQEFHSAGNAHQVLATLRGEPFADTEVIADNRINVRTWRQVERAALVRLYDRFAATQSGAWARDESTWQWLIGRRAFDRIFVAVEGPEHHLELSDSLDRILGYAVMRANRLVEMVGDRLRPTASQDLMVRACSETIERNGHDFRYDGPSDCPLHQLFRKHANATVGRESSPNRFVCLMRVAEVPSLVDTLADELIERASQAGLSLPIEIAIADEDRWRKLVISRRSARLVNGKPTRSFLRCRQSTFCQLLLGIVGVDESLLNNRLVASTYIAADLARKIFARRSWWLPPLEDLAAC